MHIHKLTRMCTILEASFQPLYKVYYSKIFSLLDILLMQIAMSAIRFDAKVDDKLCLFLHITVVYLLDIPCMQRRISTQFHSRNPRPTTNKATSPRLSKKAAAELQDIVRLADESDRGLRTATVKEIKDRVVNFICNQVPANYYDSVSVDLISGSWELLWTTEKVIH